MASKAQDQATQTAASTGAQQQDQQLAQNAATNQAFANTSRTSLFGTYNPQTNSYSGGSESQFLDPNSMNTTGLNGSYANLYNSQANTTAQGARNAVATSTQDLANRGMGKTPAGFGANQQREAYQNQANQNSTNYATDFGQQHQEAVNQYTNANNMLANNSVGAGGQAIQGNTAAAGNYSGLYGTASQQQATPLGSILGAVGTLGSAAIGKIPCWCAAEVFGGWHEPRTVLVRQWLTDNFAGTWLYNLYVRFGEGWAAAMRKHRSVRWFFTRIFNQFLRLARKAK